MLCGYSPFRSEEAKDIVAETARGRIEFHDRYWKNISQEAKDFILSLLRTNPDERPTAAEASKAHWLTTHSPSTDHDISEGIRKNFSPTKQWQSALFKVRAANRIGAAGALARERRNSEALAASRGNSFSSLVPHASDATGTSGISGTSGGWAREEAGEDDDDDDDSTDNEGTMRRQEEIHPSPDQAAALSEHAQKAAADSGPSVVTNGTNTPAVEVIAPTPTSTSSSVPPAMNSPPAPKPTLASDVSLSAVVGSDNPDLHSGKDGLSSCAAGSVIRKITMPGSFHAEEDYEEYQAGDIDVPLARTTSPESSPAATNGGGLTLGLAARMKRLVVG